jgi:hypothetical protein
MIFIVNFHHLQEEFHFIYRLWHYPHYYLNSLSKMAMQRAIKQSK